jgi:hypothetical protein
MLAAIEGCSASEPAAPVSKSTTASPTTDPSSSPLSPPDGTQWVGLGRVVVAVPDTWSGTTDDCGVLDDHVYFHERRRDSDVCGETPAVRLVPSTSEDGRAMTSGNLVETSINGIAARVGDSCPPNAACIFPFGRVVEIPSEKVALLISVRQSERSLLTEIANSLHVATDGITTVPPIQYGSTIEDAERLLTDAGLQADIDEIPGDATRTVPPAGSVVADGSVVRVRVGDG